MPLDITLSPAQVELIAKPGISLTQAYQVKNNTDSPQFLSTEVLPWVPLGTDGSVSYDHVPLPKSLQFSLNNADLKLGQSFVLKPRESRQLVLKIKSDPGTPLADSYLTFFIVQDQSGSLQSDTSGSAALARIGSHILLSTSNTENPKYDLLVGRFTANPRIVDTFFPSIRLSGVISNPGAYFTKTAAKITLKKGDKTLEEINTFPANVLSGADRDITCLSSQNEPAPCLIHPPYWPGMYTATVSLNDVPASASVSFFAFPFSFVLALGLLYAVFWLGRRSKAR